MRNYLRHSQFCEGKKSNKEAVSQTSSKCMLISIIPKNSAYLFSIMQFWVYMQSNQKKYISCLYKYLHHQGKYGLSIILNLFGILVVFRVDFLKEKNVFWLKLTRGVAHFPPWTKTKALNFFQVLMNTWFFLTMNWNWLIFNKTFTLSNSQSKLA